MTALHTVAEVAIGIIYVVGATFNGVYTLRHGDEFYGSFVEGAWFAPARWFVREILHPNATVFTAALIVFQATVAVLILTRSGLADAALFAGAGFCVCAALASSPAGTVGNLTLAGIQAALLAT